MSESGSRGGGALTAVQVRGRNVSFLSRQGGLYRLADHYQEQMTTHQRRSRQYPAGDSIDRSDRAVYIIRRASLDDWEWYAGAVGIARTGRGRR